MFFFPPSKELTFNVNKIPNIVPIAFIVPQIEVDKSRNVHTNNSAAGIGARVEPPPDK